MKILTKDALEKLSSSLELVINDTEIDAKRFEGKEFTGRNVADYLGCLGAQVRAVAKTVKLLIDERKLDDRKTNIQQYSDLDLRNIIKRRVQSYFPIDTIIDDNILENIAKAMIDLFNNNI